MLMCWLLPAVEEAVIQYLIVLQEEVVVQED
jgi:hypothetical protein